MPHLVSGVVGVSWALAVVVEDGHLAVVYARKHVQPVDTIIEFYPFKVAPSPPHCATVLALTRCMTDLLYCTHRLYGASVQRCPY